MLVMTLWLVCGITFVGTAQDKDTKQKQEQTSKKGTSKAKKKKNKVKKGGPDGTRYQGDNQPKTISSETKGTRFRGKDRPKPVNVGTEGTRSSGNERPKSIRTGNEGTRFSGRDRPKSINAGTEGTRFSGRDRPKSINAGTDGTRFSGRDRPKSINAGTEGTRFTGRGRAKTIPGGTQGTNFKGNDRPKTIVKGNDGTQYRGSSKAGISSNEGRNTIYGVRGYNNNGKGQRVLDTGPSSGTTFRGNIKKSKKIVNWDGADFAGNLKSNKRIEGTPGTRFSGNMRGGRKVIRDYGGDYSGNLKISRRPRKSEGTEYAGIVSPGISNSGRRMTIYGERGYNNKGGKVKIKDIGPAPGTTFRGHLRKSKKIVNWDGADFAGNMKVKSKSAQERDFKKQSKEQQLFAGNYRIKKNKNADLHPSSEYRGGKIKNSYAQKERTRKRKIWWSKTKKNDDQPQHLKEKGKKPKYDPKEREIWND